MIAFSTFTYVFMIFWGIWKAPHSNSAIRVSYRICSSIFLLVSSKQKSLSFSFLHFLCILVKTSPLLARIFLVQTVLFSVFIPEKIRKTKAIGKDSSSRKENKKGKICWKIKDFGKDWTNLTKSLWSRSLLRQKRRPWSSFPMTQGLQNYYIAWLIQLRKDKRNCPEEDKSNLLKHYLLFPLLNATFCCRDTGLFFVGSDGS